MCNNACVRVVTTTTRNRRIRSKPNSEFAGYFCPVFAVQRGFQSSPRSINTTDRDVFECGIRRLRNARSSLEGGGGRGGTAFSIDIIV